MIPLLLAIPIAQAVARGPSDKLLLEGKQVNATGVASASSSSYFRDVQKSYIQDGAAGVAIFTRRQMPEVAEGDRVDVTGTMHSYNGEPEVLLTDLRILGHGQPPAPVSVNPEELLSRRYAGRLVRTEAAVINKIEVVRGTNIALRAGNGTLVAHFTADQARFFPRELAPGTIVRITGISSEFTRDGRTMWQILPRVQTDLVLIERGASISTRTAWIIASVIAAVAALVFAWIVSLRRRVRTALAEYRALDERYRLLFEENPMPMWVADAKSKRILTINRAAIEKYGFTSEEFRAMSLTDLGSPGRFRTKSGRDVAVEVLSQPVVYAGHDALIFLAVESP